MIFLYFPILNPNRPPLVTGTHACQLCNILAAPGILTGTIIGMAQALGETAPLLMIGMVAFIIETPDSFTSAATAMPVQIFMWSDSAERAFYERSSLAILFLVGFLITMNSLAVILRRKFEKKW